MRFTHRLLLGAALGVLAAARWARALATTGPSHGKDATFEIDDSGGTLRDVSPHVRDVQFAVNGQSVDVTGFGSTGNWREFLSGLRGAIITVTGVLDDTADTGSSVVIDVTAVQDTRSIQFEPLGPDTGEPRLTCECLVQDVEWGTTVESESVFSWTLQVTGVVVSAAIP